MADLEVKLTKNGRGRPTKLTPELRKYLLNACQLGLGEQQRFLADLAGINEATFSRWMAGDPDFRQEINQARAKGTMPLVAKLYEKALSGHYPSLRFLLEARNKQFRIGLIPETVHDLDQAAVDLWDTLQEMRNSVPRPLTTGSTNGAHKSNGKNEDG